MTAELMGTSVHAIVRCAARPHADEESNQSPVSRAQCSGKRCAADAAPVSFLAAETVREVCSLLVAEQGRRWPSPTLVQAVARANINLCAQYLLPCRRRCR